MLRVGARGRCGAAAGGRGGGTTGWGPHERHSRRRAASVNDIPGRSPMLRLYTLGGLALERDGPPAGFISNRKAPPAPLALISGHDEHGISSDNVMADLWPESGEGHERNSLKQ